MLLENSTTKRSRATARKKIFKMLGKAFSSTLKLLKRTTEKRLRSQRETWRLRNVLQSKHRTASLFMVQSMYLQLGSTLEDSSCASRGTARRMV